MIRFTVLLIASLCLCLPLVSCGVYSFKSTGASAFKTISIEPFDNKTTEFGLTDRLTEVVIDAFIKDGTLKVVSGENADASLTGVLTSYQQVPFQFDQNDVVQQYKVTLDFDITLKNPKDQSTYWTEHFTQEGTYNAASETAEDGQARAGQALVSAILNKTTKSW